MSPLCTHKDLLLPSKTSTLIKQFDNKHASKFCIFRFKAQTRAQYRAPSPALIRGLAGLPLYPHETRLLNSTHVRVSIPKAKPPIIDTKIRFENEPGQ